MNEPGCPSGPVTAGGSAPREQQSGREGELPAMRTGSKKQLTGRKESHSDASNDGHNLPLSQPHQAAGLEWIDTSPHAPPHRNANAL